MLKYLVDSVIQLSAMMILVGMSVGYVKLKYGLKAGKLMLIGEGVGVAASIVWAVLKTTTNIIDTGYWNLWIFYISAAMFVIFLIVSLIEKKIGTVGKVINCIALEVMIALQVLYALSDFLIYPHTIMLTEESIISSVFLIKMAGVIVGFILVLVGGFAASALVKASGRGTSLLFLIILMFANTFKQVATSFSTLLARRMIASNHTIFQIAKFASNNSDLFIYISLAAAVILALILLIRSSRVNEPYSNPAQHRKIIYKWRMIRRWAWTMIIVTALTVFCMTVVYDYANQEVELSPIEETAIEDGNMYISFEQVSDGHLHRFGYTTDNGVTIRVIAIQKPNSSSYGIGLDACDICGETGYYEKDGQVVCNLCDVVMNINTIGFKGGCNPIVIDYTIENGNIVISVEELLKYENIFK